MASLWDYDNQNTAAGPKLPPGPDLDILIVGRTGHGKSATANSILAVEYFGTDSVEMFQKELDGRKLLVVDTPGPSDTEILDTEQTRKRTVHDLRLALCARPESFHAVVLVFRYGQRMTAGEIEAIQGMKKVLDGDFMRDLCVLVITYGDDFEKKMKGKKDFKTWAEEQKGYMQDVLQDCQKRCLLFNNKGNEDVLKQQRFDLVQMIDGMKREKNYKTDIFETVKKICTEAGEPVVQNYTSYLLQRLQNVFYYSIQYFFPTAGLGSDKINLNEMKIVFEELKFVTRGLKGIVKDQIDDKIKEAEDKLDEL